MTKVLVVDDTPRTTAVVARSLAKENYRILVAGDLAEVLEMVVAEQPEIVIFDIDRLGHDVGDVCSHLKEAQNLRSVPAVIVAGKTLSDALLAALDAGADDYILKPLNIENLSARLRAAMHIKNNRDTILRINEHLRREISERERAEAEATALRQRIELILGATNTGLAIIEEDLTIRYVDAQWKRKHGDPNGTKCCRYFGCRKKNCRSCAVHKAISSGKVAVSETVLRNDGDRPVQITSIPLRNGSGLTAYAAVIVDVSDRRSLEIELAQAQKLEAIGQLAAGIAHEINTPIQYIGDNTRFLQDAFNDVSAMLEELDRLVQEAKAISPDDKIAKKMEDAVFDVDVEYLTEEIPMAIRQSLEGVDRVAGIVRAMKELSHPSGDKIVDVDVNHIIENALTVSRNEWKYVADPVTDLDPDLPIIPCRQDDLSQVVLNLVVNAAQAIGESIDKGMQTKGTIKLRTRHEGQHVLISVADNGPGIAESARRRIFDPFFTTKEVGKGTGQGLSIVRSLVSDRLGGVISFETESGRGTTFFVRVPTSPPSPEEFDLDSTLASA